MRTLLMLSLLCWPCTALAEPLHPPLWGPPMSPPLAAPVTPWNPSGQWAVPQTQAPPVILPPPVIFIPWPVPSICVPIGDRGGVVCR